jgi:hypothetical protein
MDYGVSPALSMRKQAVLQSDKALKPTTNQVRGMFVAELGR